MSEENIKIKEFEDRYKTELFKKIAQITSRQREVISKIHDLGIHMDLDYDLPNIGITLNNKIIEIQHEFEKAELSMYAKEFKDYKFISLPFVGDAVLTHLIDYTGKATQILTNYENAMKNIMDKKAEKLQKFEKASFVKKFFRKIKKIFITEVQENTIYSYDEKMLLNSYLSKYRKIDSQLWKYNLKDDIVTSIVKKVREQGYSATTLKELLDDCVVPDLEKLNLADLIPQLQEKLIEEYKKDLYNSAIKEEDLYLYVPDFNKIANSSGNFHLEKANIQSKNKEFDIER